MYLKGEDLLAEDEVKAELFPYADRMVVNLDHGHRAVRHTREHLTNATVMAVAAADKFRATLDRPRGVAMLRHLADLLERQQLSAIPWGPSNPAHKPVLRALVDAQFTPKLDYDDGQDGMLSLMKGLDAEFGEALDRLIERWEHMTEGAEPELLYGFLVQGLFRRYAKLEAPDMAWATVRNAAVDEGWVTP